MRIALVVHDYHRQGGHSRYCAELAERFARQHEVHVFANSFPPGSRLYPQAAAEGLRLYFHPVWAQRSTAIGTVLSFFLPATLALRRHGPFDIVHAQGFVSWQYDVLTAHICCAAWHAERLRSGYALNWKEKLFDAIVMRLEAWLYPQRPTQPLIAISRRVAQDLDHFYGRREAVEIIPHGVDTGEFDGAQREQWRRETRSRLGLGPETFVALWVGDLRKGSQTAIEAVARNAGQILLTVSRNDPAPFAAIARSLGCEDRVRFLPPTSEIAKYYAAADAFVFPTTYDAFGMVVLEAMAMELPVVVSASAGAAELIADGEQGLLLSSASDAEACAAHLKRLEQDPAFRRRIALAGAQRALAQSWDSVAEATLRVYRQAVR